ncbi:MAG: hypothetical protein V4615_06195 [Bacteroidota bacterium]
MKKINVKTIVITCMVVLIASTGAFAHDHSERQKQLSADLKAQKETINRNLDNLNQQQEKVKAMGKQCRETHSAAEHKNYKQANADLKRYKSDLKESHAKLMKTHKAHINDHKHMIRDERKTLERTQRNLDRYKAKGAVATLTEAEKVMNSRAEMRDLFSRLERARLDRDKDTWVINKEYNDNKAKLSLSLSTTDRSANAQSMAK